MQLTVLDFGEKDVVWSLARENESLYLLRLKIEANKLNCETQVLQHQESVNGRTEKYFRAKKSWKTIPHLK